MENSRIIMEEKLGFFGLIKESLKIPFKNLNFIIFAFITSLPLFFSLSMYEIIFQQTLIETGKIIRETIAPTNNPYDYFNYDYEALLYVEKWIGKFSYKLLLLGLLYIGILHFMDLFNTIAIVDISSMIYKEEKPMNLKAMFSRFISETRLKGPLITSIYVLLLASLISFGLITLAPYMLISFTIFLAIPFLLIYIYLLMKYFEWSSIWNMGIVISILEEKQGDVAIIVSSYLSRGRRLCGFLVVLVYFAWRFALKFSCLYARWKTETRGASVVMSIMVHIGFICLANVLQWVIFVVYFYDCKKRSSEKKIDVEEGKIAEQAPPN